MNFLIIFTLSVTASFRTKQRANDLFKLLMNLTERTSRRLGVQREELSLCAGRDKDRLYGDLISANMYRIQKGDSIAVVENFYEEDCPKIEIKLDVRKTPSQNAQRYYSEYKKAVTAGAEAYGTDCKRRRGAAISGERI